VPDTGDESNPVNPVPVTIPVSGGNLTAPSDTVVDPTTGVATIPSGGSITLADGVTVITVPPATTIDPKTGVITLPNGGRIVFSAPDGGANMTSTQSGDRVFIVSPGTTVDPATGVMTVTNGGVITFPDGSTVTVVPGTTIDPFTGEIVRPSAEVVVPDSRDARDETGTGGGGCDTTGAAALAILGLAGMMTWKKRG
jgi:hypothetical protein